MVEEKLLVTPMQTGQGTKNPPQDTSSFKQERPLTGRAKETCVALSTAKVEYVALSAAVRVAAATDGQALKRVYSRYDAS